MRYQVLKRIDFCYGHRLLHYAGPCRYLHGHNARVEILAEAEQLDAQGMAVDFRRIKTVVQTWIDAHLDHRMILQREDPLVELLRQADEPVFVMDRPPSAEHLARLISDQAQAAGLPVGEVRLWESATSCAIYRPER